MGKAKGKLTESEKVVHLSRKEVAVLVLGLAPTYAGLFLDDPVSLAICLGVSLIFALWVCVIHDGAMGYRIATGLVATVLYAAIAGRLYYRHLEAKQEDVQKNLSIEILTPSFKPQPVTIPYLVKNNGSTTIIRHQDSCIIYKMLSNTHAGIEAQKGVVTPWHEVPIGPNGDGQSDFCSLPFVLQGDIQCVDIGVKVDYSIEGQKDDVRTKNMRFVASTFTGPHWFQESPNATGNFCDGTESR